VELLGIALRVLGTNRSAHLLESWADSNALIAMPTIRRPTWEERISLKNAFVYKLNGAQRLQGCTARSISALCMASRRQYGGMALRTRAEAGTFGPVTDEQARCI
jgi:hypothetical protein